MNFRYYFFLLLIILIFQVKCKKNIDITLISEFEFNNNYSNCQNDILYGNIKFLKNDYNYCFRNIPRRNRTNFTYNNTFEKYDKELKIFKKWPNENENQNENFTSIADFEFDEDDNIYLLDEINNNRVNLYKYNKEGQKKEKYEFKKETNDLLINLVIDKINNYVYISFYNNEEAGIYVIPLKHSIEYKKIFFMKSLLYDLKYIFDNELFNYYSYIINKTVSITLSCDGKYLLFSPLNSRMLYSIKTKKLRNNSIKNITINDVNAAYKNDSSSSIIFSNMGNLYLTGMENKIIYLANQIDSNLAVFDFKILDKRENDNMEWPTKLSITDGVLYINSKSIEKVNNSSNITIHTHIYKTLIDDDKSYIYKCAGLGYNWKTIAYIFWGILIFIILLVLIFMFIGNELDQNINIKKKK